MKVPAPNIHPFAANGHFSLYYRPFFNLSSHPYSLQKVEWGQIGIIEAEAVDIKVDDSLAQRLQQVSAHGVIGEIETGKIGAVGQGAFHFGAIMFEF